MSLRSGRAMSGYVRLALSPSPPDGLAPGSLVNAGVTLFSPSPRRASPPPGKGAYGQNSNVGPPPIQASFANVAGAAMPSVRKAMPIHCKNRHRGCTRAALIAVAALPRDNVERGWPRHFSGPPVKIMPERLRTSVPAWCQPVMLVRVTFRHFGHWADTAIRTKYGRNAGGRDRD